MKKFPTTGLFKIVLSQKNDAVDFFFGVEADVLNACCLQQQSPSCRHHLPLSLALSFSWSDPISGVPLLFLRLLSLYPTPALDKDNLPKPNISYKAPPLHIPCNRAQEARGRDL